MNALSGRVAVVTGGARGIGAAIVDALARAGARVAIADVLDGEPLARRLAAEGVDVLYQRTDVASEGDVAALAQATRERLGTADILVNNAAIFSGLTRQPFLKIEAAEWDQVMAVNTRGPFLCAKAFAPGMIDRKRGKIVNVASATVFKGIAGLLHYTSSKGALVAMTRCLARELGAHGICVNAIAPGLTMSEALAANPNWRGPAAEATVKTRAIQREQSPADLVGTLLYLASSDSDFVTGQTIVVDGGAVMR